MVPRATLAAEDGRSAAAFGRSRHILPSRAALGLLAGLFPAARRKLEALGFGLVQQGDQASPGTAEGHA
jgi:hypothetical protein